MKKPLKRLPAILIVCSLTVFSFFLSFLIYDNSSGQILPHEKTFSLTRVIFDPFVKITGEDDPRLDDSTQPHVFEEKTTEDLEALAEAHGLSVKEWQLSSMNEKLEKRGFSSVARSFFRECFDLLYENYDKWRPLYKDLPDKAQYIQDVLINTIDKITDLEMVEENSPKGQEMVANIGAGFTGSDFFMSVLYKDPEKCSEREHQSDLESFFHECIHCSNSGVFDEECYIYENLQYAITEGEATFHLRFLFPPTTATHGSAFINNPVNNLSVNYERDCSTSYYNEAYLYESLNHIAGYDALHSVGRYSDMNALRKVVSKRYGSELENELWNKTEKFLTLYDKGAVWESEETFEAAIELQNLFLEFVSKDVEELDANDPVQVKKYIDVYYNYKLRIMPKIEKEDDSKTVLIDDYFDTEEIEDILIDKIIQSKAMVLSDNTELNRKALKAVLYASNENYYINGYDFFLPVDVSNTKYTLVEKDEQNNNKPCLYMDYEEPYSFFYDSIPYFVLNEDGSFEIKII